LSTLRRSVSAAGGSYPAYSTKSKCSKFINLADVKKAVCPLSNLSIAVGDTDQVTILGTTYRISKLLALDKRKHPTLTKQLKEEFIRLNGLDVSERGIIEVKAHEVLKELFEPKRRKR